MNDMFDIETSMKGALTKDRDLILSSLNPKTYHRHSYAKAVLIARAVIGGLEEAGLHNHAKFYIEVAQDNLTTGDPIEMDNCFVSLYYTDV